MGLALRLTFHRAAEILGITTDDVRSLVVEMPRRLPAIYVTQVGHAEPYEWQLLRVDSAGNAFDMSVGGIDGAVHTGFLRIERAALEKFIRDNDLPARHETEFAPHPATEPGAPVPKPQAAAPAPVADSASNGPLPLTTGDIAFCFDGIRWNEQQWRKPLGNKPKWLQSCVAIPGQRGVSETRWNPVLIAAALVHDGHAQARSIRAKFQTKPLLKDWQEAWKTYEADNFDAQ